MAASYPTAVKSFTTKNAGDTIQPAHINDLQDEVVALESGLINGDAPLQSSNSTLAALTVTGGSTLASLQVDGDSTIAGTLTVATIISTSITARTLDSFVRAQISTAVQFDTAATALVFGDRQVDLSSEYDSTNGVFTPKSSGYYQITAKVQTLAADIAYVGVYVNSTLVAKNYESHGAGNIWHGHTLSFLRNLSSGAAGAVTVKAWIESSTGRTDTGAGTYLNIAKLF